MGAAEGWRGMAWWGASSCSSRRRGPPRGSLGRAAAQQWEAWELSMLHEARAPLIGLYPIQSDTKKGVFSDP